AAARVADAGLPGGALPSAVGAEPGAVGALVAQSVRLEPVRRADLGPVRPEPVSSDDAALGAARRAGRPDGNQAALVDRARRRDRRGDRGAGARRVPRREVPRARRWILERARLADVPDRDDPARDDAR